MDVSIAWWHISFVIFGLLGPNTGEGNGTPLQCSCLENPRDGGAWWAAVYGVAQSWTRLKRFSSSSSKWSQTTLWYSEARLLSIIPPCFLYPISRSVSSKVDWWHKWVTFKGKVNPKGLLTHMVRSTPWYLSTLEANNPTSTKAELRECLKYYHASLVWDYPN